MEIIKESLFGFEHLVSLSHCITYRISIKKVYSCWFWFLGQSTLYTRV